MNDTPIYDHLAAKFGVRTDPRRDALAAAWDAYAAIDDVIASFEVLLTWAATEGDQA